LKMSYLVYGSVKLVFGTLYPAYSSFKAVKSKNVKEYFQWMIYWIVFALITLTEEVADLFLSFWFPLYYELKILLLIWLLSPATRGSTFLYRQVIHPILTKREEEIDDFVKKCKEESYSLGVKYTRAVAQKMTSTVIQTALAGGGGLVKTLRHSYNISDLRGGQLGGDDAADADEGYDEHLGEGLGPRNWEDGKVEMRTGKARSRGSGLSLKSESEQSGIMSEERRSSRRKTSSLYGTLPRSGARPVNLTRNGSQYGTLPRRTRRQRPALPIFAPLEKSCDERKAERKETELGQDESAKAGTKLK